MRYIGAVVLLCLSLPGSLSADESLEQLIDELVNVSEPGVGYSPWFSGSEFLPYEGTDQVHGGILGATGPARSQPLLQLVSRGFEAVPVLLKHIGDGRSIKMNKVAAIEVTVFCDEYDFNSRTRLNTPQGVCRVWEGFDQKTGVRREVQGSLLLEENPEDGYSVTVGDLCFVALGQILNRSFSAVRYEPTGIMIVSSPTDSTRLREVILEDWQDFTPEKHRQLLVDDFQKPDHWDRQVGAYLRLAFYYPDAVEAPVLEELKKPVFNSLAVERFCHKQLYQTGNAEPRRKLYEQFIREHGPQYAAGVLHQLFDDLWIPEALERGTLAFDASFTTQPRELLIELFDQPPAVKSSDRPRRTVATEEERASLIGAMTRERSRKIGDLVQAIYLANPQNDDLDDLAPACLKCLANRGYEDFLVEQLRAIDVRVSKVSYLQEYKLQAIGTSRENRVQEELPKVLTTAGNDRYFLAAASGWVARDDALVLKHASRVLKDLPDQSRGGELLLEWLAEQYPEKSREVFQAFLANGSISRAQTVCHVLYYGHPLAREVLTPLLKDTRPLKGYDEPTRVCDLAAQAIQNREAEESEP